MVVDSFAESRQHDVLHLAEELEHEDINEKRPAWQLCVVSLEQTCGCLATSCSGSVLSKSISVAYDFNCIDLYVCMYIIYVCDIYIYMCPSSKTLI